MKDVSILLQRARQAPVSNRGFNIVELMVVMVVISILLLVAVPNFAARNARSRAEGAARDMAARMQLTRQRAVMERVPYRMTISSSSYYFEKADTDSTWTMEPDRVYEIEGIAEVQREIGGSVVADEVHFETRGTIESDDAPALITFISANQDTARLSLVRTGRAVVDVTSAN